MKHRSPQAWDPALTFLLIGGIIVFAVLLLGPLVMGADWRVPANFPATYDTAYTCFYEDFVLQDSSKGRGSDNDYDTTFTYTAGSYLRCIIWYKYDSVADEWGTWTFEYNSATAATLDSATVYGAMVDAATDEPTLFLGGAGSGQYAVTILAWDSTTSMAIPTLGITVRPEDQSGLSATITTDATGYATWNTDDLTNYVYIADAAGWTIPMDTFEVSGSQTDTIYGDQYDPDAPADTFFCAVYGYLGELQDVATRKIKRIEVCFTPTKAVNNSCSNVGLVGGEVCTETNDDGEFNRNLLYSSCMLDGTDSVQYRVTVEGDDREWLITVPDAASYQVDFQD